MIYQAALRALAIPSSPGRLGPKCRCRARLFFRFHEISVNQSATDRKKQTPQTRSRPNITSAPWLRLGPTNICRQHDRLFAAHQACCRRPALPKRMGVDAPIRCYEPKSISQSHLGRMTAATIDHWDFVVVSFAAFFEICRHMFYSKVQYTRSSRRVF